MASVNTDIHAPDDVANPGTNNQGHAIVPLEMTINIPDLKNGDLADITQAAPKASISSQYKWAVVTQLPVAKSVDAVEFVIRGTFAQLCSATTTTLTDAVRAELRKHAIVLGSIRSGAAAAFRLVPGDMNTNECTTSGLEFSTASGRIVASNGTATAGAKYTLAIGMSPLVSTEVAVVGMLVYLGMAVPVLQGISLVTSGHHFLPTTKNQFMGMKRQTLGLGNDASRQWIESMGETFDDLAFHKACHPISPPAKRRWAKMTDVRDRLVASGHGAAAARLPATPSEAAIGKTSIALVVAAAPTIRSMGHTVTTTDGERLLFALERASEGPDERVAIQAIQGWAATHSSSVAFCAGIAQFVHESTAQGRNTLLMAYSVRKLMAEHPTDVQRGQTYARVASDRIREAMREGTFPDVAINM
jgi:hypothetical protein